MPPNLNPKKNTMKKLFAILAVACVMASCTGGDSDKSANADSAKKDSVTQDAMKTMDAAKDSMNKMVDATKDSVNKAVNAVKDSMNKH